MSWDVVVRHDTTMWNEGFEHAREPYLAVPVISEDGARAVAAWVTTTYDLQKLPWDDIDKAFTAEVHPTAGQSDQAPVPSAEARELIAARIAEWRGL